MNEITYTEINQIKESVCDGCKALLFIHDFECYKVCEPFQEKLKEMREEE